MSGTASFSGLDFYVPKDDEAELTVWADVNSISAGDATAAEFIDLNIAFNDFEALASDSGETYEGDKIDADQDEASDLDFGTLTFTDEDADISATDTTGTDTLGSSTSFTTENEATGDEGSVPPVGTIICIDEDSGGVCADEAIYVVTGAAVNDAGTEVTVTATLIDDAAADAAYAVEDDILFAVPGDGYLTGAHQMHVYGNKPTVALSSSSPSGDRSVSTSDSAFIFTISAEDDEEDVVIRTGEEGDDDADPTEGGVDDTEVTVPAAAAGDLVDGTSAITWTEVDATGGAAADGDCFSLAGSEATAGTDPGEFGSFSFVSFWMKADAADSELDEFALVLDDDDVCTTAPTEIQLDTEDSVFVNGTAVTTGQDISDAVDEWIYVTVDISGDVAADDDNIGISLTANIDTALDDGETVFWDGFVLHNEMLVVEITSDDDFNANEAAAQTASLVESGSVLAEAGIGFLDSAGTDGSSAAIVFVPITGTDSDIEIAQGGSKTFTVRVNSSTLLDEDADVDDPVTFTIDLGSSSDGTVTPGGFWWFEDNATVLWLGQVDDTTLTSNTVNY